MGALISEQNDESLKGVDVARMDPNATATGMRRVDFVRLVVQGQEQHAELVGVGYRLPVCRPASLALAAQLVNEGTPLVTRHVGEPSTTSEMLEV